MRLHLVIGAALSLVLAAALAGCGRAGEAPVADPLMDVFRRQAQEEGLTRTQTDGKRLFAHYCETCHGEAGTGDGQNAYNLEPKPPDFQQSLSQNPASYRRQIVEGGTAAVGRSALCPPWGRNLSAAQIDALLAYLEALAKPPAQADPPK
jgi:mono/diheme cytochrome c family protein